MRVWITSCLVVFGMMELYQWIKHLTLPLPIFILGGALLAIASNYDKLGSCTIQESTSQTPSLLNAGNSLNWNSLSKSQTKPVPQARPSISFVINRSREQRHTLGDES